MKRLFILLFILTGLLLAGCDSGDDGHSHGEESDHSHEETAQQTEEEHGHAHPEENEEHEHDEESEQTGSGSVTHWADETELFMEYPELIVGQQATFAVHLTRLSDFSPIANSEVYFTFRSDDGTEITRRETEVQIPGIYGPDITFEQAGRYDLTIEIYGMVNDTLQVSGIPVYNTADEIPHAHTEEHSNLITFLKEQQWDIPFSTREVEQRTLTQTVDAHGETMAAQNSQAVVSAPFSGIILPSQNASLPVEGQQLQKGALLAVLNPAIQSGGGDNYVQQFINAQSELELDQSNLERSRRLYEKEAIPERELQQARLEYRQALTRYQTINEVLQIDTTAIDGSGRSADSYRFELKAPVAGSIIESHVSPGMQVEAGQPLYRIADDSRVWLKAHVPASRKNQVANAQDASFRIQGDDQLYTISELGGSLISRSNSVDSQSRTLSLVYEFDNTEKGLPLGMFSTVHITTDTKEQVLAIPESALMEEEGTYNVYVHVSGESFEKRRVTTGIKEGGWVEITSGLREGEQVVTENAYQLELASRSSETPEHGHSH